MISRHRNKAILGVAVWFAVIFEFVLLYVFGRHKDGEPDIDGMLVVKLFGAGLVIQFLSFFWGGHHLAKAKGYPNAVLLPGLFPCLQILVLTVLLVLPDKNSVPSRRANLRKSSHSSESPIGRVVRYRRNALLGNSFGLFGILIGISMVLFPSGYTTDPDTETVIGIFVFLLGYSGVITGCWWWAKAKGWPDVIVFIGLLPPAIVCTPWVRLIFVAIPELLHISMVMMPLILLVIMMVLPDRSGLSKRNQRNRR